MTIFDPTQLSPRRPMIMGILNVTPDSFSDGGRFNDLDAALRQAEAMKEQGAKIIDIGGESTRPGAAPVSVEEELERVAPVVEAIAAKVDCYISVDSSSPQVMTEAHKLGAHLLNDVRALRREGALEAAAATGLPVCLMHMQGEPGTMQDQPEYDDVIADVGDFLQERANACMEAGIDRHRIILDPGFGFGKTLDHNYQLLNGLDQLLNAGFPLLTGLSRKRMIKQVMENSDDEAAVDQASAAAALLCIVRGASIVRVHNVEATMAAIQHFTK